ncbi:SbmA/BacA-like family transporter, partial [Acinetobacter baumannii]
QRITDDVRSFTASTLSFVILVLNALITIFSFSGVLWSISPRLLVGAVLYALTGSLLTLLVGRRLVGLNVRQLDCEAELRSELTHARQNTE